MECVEVPGLCRSSRRPANDVFQLEKIPDHLLEKYFELLTDLSLFELPEQRAIASSRFIVTQYHGKSSLLSKAMSLVTRGKR